MVIDMKDFYINKVGILLALFSFFALLTQGVYAADSRGITIEKSSTRQATNINRGVYRALIIGNNQYRNFSTLATAVNDARETDKVLREKYGFKTKLLLNADRYTILAALNELRETLDADDNLLIYYAGHGDRDRRDEEISYWLGVDADPHSQLLEVAELVGVADHESVTAVFLSAGAVPAPLAKVLKERGESVSIKKMRERDAGRWVGEAARERGLRIESEAVAILVRHFGSDVAALGQALDQDVLFRDRGVYKDQRVAAALGGWHIGFEQVEDI